MDSLEIYDGLECISSLASIARIDSGVIASDKMKIRIKFMVSVQSGGAIVGYSIADIQSYRIFLYGNRFNYDVDGANHRMYTNGKINTYYDFELGYCYIKDMQSGNILVSRTTWGEWNHGISVNFPGDISSHYHYYGVEFYENDMLVRDFRPARRRSDGHIGMIDMVSQTFYENLGSEPFVAGEPTGEIYKLKKQN